MIKLISDSFLKEDPEIPVRISSNHILQAVFDVISKPTSTVADVMSSAAGECNISCA